MERRRARAWLFVVAVAYLSASLYPFRPDLPTVVDNGARWTSEGSLHLAAVGRADVTIPSDWLGDVERGAPLHIDLEVRSGARDQRGPARILSVSQDHLNADLSIQQDIDGLEIRLRRPGSDLSGDPAFVVAGVFETDTWRRIGLDLRRGRLQVTVDGDVRVDATTRAPLGWDPGHRITLGNEPTGQRPWLGTIRRATMTVGNERQDLLATPNVVVPSGWTDYPLRWRDAPSFTGSDAVVLPLHVLGFVLIGGLVVAATGWSRRRAVAAALALGVVIQLGKAFAAGRHPSLTDLAIQVVAAAIGAALAARWVDHATGWDRQPAPSVRR